MACVRRLLWGAARPAPEPQPLLMLGYGLLSWTYSLTFLCLMLWGLARLLGSRWGLVGWGAGGMLAVMSLRNMFRGLSAGELTTMIRTRYARTGLWGIGLTAFAAGGFVPIDDWATGEFQVRPTTRQELRAPLAAFIVEVHVEEGDAVTSGQCVVRLAIPDLETRIAQKEAEVHESQACLRLLEHGARPEEIAEQRLRVQRGRQWRDQAGEDLQHAREVLAADLARLDHALEESRAELEAARKRFQRDEALTSKGAVTKDRLEEAERALRVAQAKAEQRQAEQRARRAEGTRAAAAELGRRSKELADDEGRLALLEAGTRQDEIEAERSRLGRLAEEERYLVSLRDKLTVTSAVAGIVTTPRLKERVGQFVHEGDSLCVIEQASALVAEIALDEQQHSRVCARQRVQLKFRALPFQTFAGHVERIAPAAVKEATMAQGRFTVYCRLDGDTADLRQGMSGYARISTGRQPIGAIATDRALRLVRTEFWW
jgi:putative peptide zinc metalloprotease protein